MEKVTNLVQFIEKAQRVHPNRYNYDNCVYINSTSKVCIRCNQCNTFIFQTPNSHLNGVGCRTCGYMRRSTSRIKTTSEFIEKAKKIHADKYDYDKVTYTGVKNKVIIICNECKWEFYQLPPNHLTHKQGCPNCAGCIQTTNTFIQRSNLVHGDLFDYSKSVYLGTYKHVNIICNKHGEFRQIPKLHLQGTGCPKCRETSGEREIRKWLVSNKLPFISQYAFEDCTLQRKLRFDFYLPEYNLIIEYDGEYHFFPVQFKGTTKKRAKQIHEKAKAGDALKNNYCIKHNIQLIRIDYTQRKNIANILKGVIHQSDYHQLAC